VLIALEYFTFFFEIFRSDKHTKPFRIILAKPIIWFLNILSIPN